MKRLEKLGCCLFLFLFLLLFSANVMGVRAEDQELRQRQIVFLLDESDSMRGEFWEQALDEIAMVVTALPPEYEAALITYSDDIDNVIDFGNLSVDAINEFRKRQPNGYTNTGIALQKAIGQFSETADEKQIIIISDGEICARGKGETEKALELYYETVGKAAAQNVKIDVLLFQTDDVEDQISWGAADTGGFVFEKTKQDMAPLFAVNFLFERLGISRVMLGTWDSLETATEISLQNTFAERVKILLISGEHIEDIKVSCQSRNVTMAQGARFAVIDLDRPVESNVVLQYVLSEKGKVNAYLIKEYSLSSDISLTYEAAARQHTFRIGITDVDGENVLADAGFCEKVAIYLNGNRVAYTIEQGDAVIPYTIEESQEVAVRVDFGDLNGIVSCKGAENSLYLDLPPLPEPEEGMPYLWVYVVAAGVALLFVLLLIWFILAKKKNKNTTDGSLKAGSVEILKYGFSGQIVIYVLKNPWGEDVPPASVNLYRKESREPFDFVWVKSRCGIPGNLKDADRIMFYGGENHALCVKNTGGATLSCGKDILLRNKKYRLDYNEKLLMVFNDGEIEIELHYKNMKPSERER